MNEQEAKDWLKAIRVTTVRGTCIEQRKEALHLGMQALEKQIPQKIFHKGYEYEGQIIYPVGINGVPYDLCPNCKINLCTDGFLGRDKKRMKYCENCGQKLDWGE